MNLAFLFEINTLCLNNVNAFCFECIYSNILSPVLQKQKSDVKWKIKLYVRNDISYNWYLELWNS